MEKILRIEKLKNIMEIKTTLQRLSIILVSMLTVVSL